MAPEGGKQLNKQRVSGIPALIVDDVRLIQALEEEPAYTRRERMLNVKENPVSEA